MKKLFFLTAALVAALGMNAAIIEIDLNSAKEMVASENCSAKFAVNDGALNVNYTSGGWEWAGVEFPLDNLTSIPSINYSYVGDGAESFGENGIVLYVYLRDSEGNRWIKTDYWPNLMNTEWQNESITPDGALDWDAAGYEIGEKTFAYLGFIANPGEQYSGTFSLRDIKLVVSEGGDPIEGKVKPLYLNGDRVEEVGAFTRDQCGSISQSLNMDEVSGIACSRVTPGYIWMESDNFGTHVIATDEQGQHKYMQVNLNTEGYGVRYWDWEDLCGGVYEGKNYIFIGAFGDNKEEDDFYSIVFFEEPEIIDGGEITLTPNQIQFVYPDGQSHNCESMLYDNVEQMLYIVTKVYYDVCQVYSLPMSLNYGTEAQTLTYVCDLGLKSDIGFNDGGIQCRGFHLATAADISPDGKYILIKNHNNIEGEADYSWILYWERQEGESVADVVKRQPVVLDCYQHEWQGEAICWLNDDVFYTTSDSDGEPPIYKYTRVEGWGVQNVAVENTNKLIMIGKMLYVRTQDGLYTLDGRKVQ